MNSCVVVLASDKPVSTATRVTTSARPSSLMTVYCPELLHWLTGCMGNPITKALIWVSANIFLPVHLAADQSGRIVGIFSASPCCSVRLTVVSE